MFRNCWFPDAGPDPRSDGPLPPAHASIAGWKPIGRNTPTDRSKSSFVTHRSQGSPGPHVKVEPGMVPLPCAEVLINPVAIGADPKPLPFLSERPINQSPGHEKPQVE